MLISIYLVLHGLHIPSIALDELPECSVPLHIQELDSHSHTDDLMSINSVDSGCTRKSKKSQSPVLISNDLPPVPASLVKRVEQGFFIEMAELSPSYFDSAEFNAGTNLDHASNSPQFPTLWNGYSALGSIWQLYLVQSLNVLLI